MASGRMLRSQISCSPQVNDLSLKAALLFTWIIPHLDDFGRMQANPRRLKAVVVPMRDDIDLRDIHASLLEMEKQNLLSLYSVENELYISVSKFEQHQQGLHKRTISKFPPPPALEAALNLDSGKFREIPGDSPRTEQNRREQEQEEKRREKRNVEASPLDILISEIFDFWKKETKKEKSILDAKRKSKIKSALKLGYSAEKLKNAISGCLVSKWHIENKQTKLTSILRDADCIDGHIERFEKDIPSAQNCWGYKGPTW